MRESEIQNFWQQHPCDDMQVGGLASFRDDYEAFFRKIDEFRYTQEAHILRCLDKIDFAEKETLEIGLGQGSDAEQLIRRGARWTGIDLTDESIQRVKIRLELKGLPYVDLTRGSALDLPFEDSTFDIVYSHGVLHHIPDIATAQKEIARVLKPNGQLIMMLYAKYSLNYLVSISLLRRFGLALLSLIRYPARGVYGQHLKIAREVGLFNYLKMENFIHRNTDGPLNPYSKVYDRTRVTEDFDRFEPVKAYKTFMHAPPIPVAWLPLGGILGWHLWVHMSPRSLAE